MKLKRFASGFVAAVMAFAVLGTPLGDILPFVRESVATTAGAESYGNFEYSVLSDGTVEITSYNGSAEKVDIPAKIDGKSVTSIAQSAFSNCHSLMSINIPSSVTSIGFGAFGDCISLTSITIPFSVTSIGKCAFARCADLVSITILGSVTSIEDATFMYCTSLTNITMPNSVTRIGNDVFFGCKNLVTITIPDSVTSIGESAFFYCESLATITIPDSMKSIGASAFTGCKSLKSITIPDSVTSIGGNAFSCCNSSFVIRGNANSIAERYAKVYNEIFKSVGYSKPAITTKSSYDIKIVDNNGNLIKNATISVDTISRKATGGFASISFPSAGRI